MNTIKVSYDNQSYQSKPVDSEAAQISRRIGKNIAALKCQKDVYSFIRDIGTHGHTFSPATFTDGTRKADSFEQMQLLVLDFDGKISYESVCERAEACNIPLMAAYDTFSSKEHDRFRVIFLNDVPVTDNMAAKIYKGALMTIFPEADRTDSDISKMYYGGKGLLYYNESLPTIDMESTLRNMTYYLRNKYGATHYKKHIKKFADKYGIRLNKKGLPDISIAENYTEESGTHENGKNSPKSIIFYKSNGENLPNACYEIHLWGDGTKCSVGEKHHKKHLDYRSDTLHGITGKCRLFRVFASGERRLHHNELFGISTNLIHVETGINKFKEILSKYPDYYDDMKQGRWDFYLKYNKDQNYNPHNCDMFCAYRDICMHGSNILSTVQPKRGTMEKLSGYTETYDTIEEVQEDLIKNLTKAINSCGTDWHVIKAQTAAGKTEAFLNLMKASEGRFLIAVPTNKLKRDIKSRAHEKGIKLMATPSLDEIKDDMPSDIWEHIELLRETGQHKKVHPFISRIAEEENVACLKKYLDKLKKFEEYEGHTVTTHRKFLNMDKNNLNKYNTIIIDEDIIFSSIIPNQCEITVSDLKKILKKAAKEASSDGTYNELINKIKRLLNKIKKKSLFRLPGFEWDDGKEDDGNKNEENNADGILELADIPSFCMAEYFIYRNAEEERNLAEDSVVFLRPYKFKKIKHIMVSATADKDICEYCFGKENVKFYECKRARYRGTLNQYFDKSMSRNYIDKDTDVLKRISEWSGFPNMITFKKYAVGDMYFGNAIGCDYLKGQDIDVVGTPYQVDFLYKLFPFSLGLGIDEDAKMKSCQVCHNGYMFTFTTYGEEHDILRKFHFWMIESELEQAVGRARLLRCDCTVNLYSNFPIRQAVMKKSEYDNS